MSSVHVHRDGRGPRIDAAGRDAGRPGHARPGRRRGRQLAALVLAAVLGPAAAAGPPAGDECEDCIPVGEGVFPGHTFDNTDATGDDTSCALFDTFDEWYCYTASCSGMAVASTCNGGVLDTSLAVFASCGGVEITCDDDTPGCAFDTSVVSWPVIEGTTYYVRIAGFFFTQGDFTLTITCEGCPGTGACFEANGTPGCETLNCCLSVCDLDPSCCDTAWDQDCADTALDVCAFCPGPGNCFQDNGTPGCSDIDCCTMVCDSDPFCCDVTWDNSCASAALGICADEACPGDGDCFAANGTPGCSDLTCCAIICSDDPVCCDVGWDQDCADAADAMCEQPPACGTPGTGDCFAANGTPFCESEECCDEVCVVLVQCCLVEWDELCALEADALCRPPNDDCEAAIPLVDGATPFDTIDGTTDGATLEDFCDLGAFGDEQIYNDVWYTYVAGCTGELTVSTCGTADFDSRLAVYDAGACPIDPALVIGCNDDAAGCPGFTSELTVPVVKDQSYVIRVGGFSPDDSGAGVLQVSSVRAEPPTLTVRSIVPPGGLDAGEPFDVWVVMSKICPEEAAGFQAYLQFETDELVFVGGVYTDEPFGAPGILPIEATLAGEIDLAATIDTFEGQAPTSDDSILAVLTFETIGTACAPTIAFREHDPPTRVHDEGGQDLLPLALDVFPPERGPGDVNFDGEVDVDDLIELIKDWGLCPPAPEFCNADLDCNGDVNVLDLIAVVVNWTDF